MARQSYAVQQSKIQKEISKLQKRAEALQAKRRKPVLAEIVRSMRANGITPEDVTAAYRASSSPARGRRKAVADGASAAAKRPVAPKYRNPQTGDTWSGRGKSPRWLVAAEAGGTARDSFLIES